MKHGPRVIEGPFDDLNEEMDQKPPLKAAQNITASKETFGDMTNEEYVVHNIIECNVNSTSPSNPSIEEIIKTEDGSCQDGQNNDDALKDVEQEA